jgi:cytochrome c2
VATSNLTVVTGFHESWDGDLLVASLRGKALFRIRLDEGHVRFVEEIPVGERIRYVHQYQGGRLLLWTDSKKLVFLEPAPLDSGLDFLEEFVGRSALEDTRRKRLRVALSSCLVCHALDPHDEQQDAPPLGAVFGAPIAASGYEKYSEALLDVPGAWSRDALLRFLEDPSGFAPGTTMPDPGVSDPRIRQAVVDFLEALESRQED